MATHPHNTSAGSAPPAAGPKPLPEGIATVASEILDRSAPVLARWIVHRQHEDRAPLARTLPADNRDEWIADTQVRLRYLAEADAIAMPQLFLNYVAWQCASFTSNGLPPDLLTRNLQAMRSVLLDELPEAGHSVIDHVDRAIELSRQPAAPAPSVLDQDLPHIRIIQGLLLAGLEGERAQAMDLLQDAFDLGLSVPELYEHVLKPAQHEIGRMWQAGEITIAEEHHATGIVQAAMAQLIARCTPAPRTGLTVVAASVGGEMHDLGVRMVADLFELAGWRSISLGANTPPPEIVRACIDFSPALLALSASLGCRVRQVAHTVQAVRQAFGKDAPRIMVGGLAFELVPQLATVIGADAFASSAAAAVHAAEALVASSRRSNQPPPG